MTTPPPLLPKKREPDEVIRGIEDDPLSQLIWRLLAKLAALIHNRTEKHVDSAVTPDKPAPAANSNDFKPYPKEGL